MRIDLKKAEQKGYHVEVSDDSIDIYPDSSEPILPQGLWKQIREHLTRHSSLVGIEADQHIEQFAYQLAKAHMVKDLFE